MAGAAERRRRPRMNGCRSVRMSSMWVDLLGSSVHFVGRKYPDKDDRVRHRRAARPAPRRRRPRRGLQPERDAPRTALSRPRHRHALARPVVPAGVPGRRPAIVGRPGRRPARRPRHRPRPHRGRGGRRRGRPLDGDPSTRTDCKSWSSTTPAVSGSRRARSTRRRSPPTGTGPRRRPRSTHRPGRRSASVSSA